MLFPEFVSPESEVDMDGIYEVQINWVRAEREQRTVLDPLVPKKGKMIQCI